MEALIIIGLFAVGFIASIVSLISKHGQVKALQIETQENERIIKVLHDQNKTLSDRNKLSTSDSLHKGEF